MSKAEEIALAAFPPIYIGYGKTRYDANEEIRNVFLQGYRIGMRETWLTWIDVRMFLEIASDLLPDEEDEESAEKHLKQYPTEKAFYEAVMKRYVELKKR